MCIYIYIIEYYIYGLNNSLLYPSLEDGTIPYSLYSLLDNDLFIDPALDLQTYGFEQGGYNVLYNFYLFCFANKFKIPTLYILYYESNFNIKKLIESNETYIVKKAFFDFIKNVFLF